MFLGQQALLCVYIDEREDKSMELTPRQKVIAEEGLMVMGILIVSLIFFGIITKLSIIDTTFGEVFVFIYCLHWFIRFVIWASARLH